jgi:GNAT superfamily N-acetyltransferase
VTASVRPYRSGDASALALVMWRSVREAALTDYSTQQTEAWLPEPLGTEFMENWATDGRQVLVALDETGQIIGDIDLDPNGHIDHLFCVPEAVGRGVAGALYSELEATAESQGVNELRVEASEAARRFFEKKGFALRARREWELRGVQIHNYEMSKTLSHIVLREFSDEDWTQIYPFFTQIVAAGETFAYPEGLSIEAASEFWVLGPPGRTVVAAEGSQVVGSAHMGPNRPGRGSHVATASFMVDATHRGKGVGRALGRYVVDWANAAGYTGIQFNAVVETNVAAVSLWQSLGFEILATVPDAFHHRERGFVGLHLMFKRLTLQNT